jgi:anti-sigma regulatory factor (Ser/Thr protein kinase)
MRCTHLEDRAAIGAAATSFARRLGFDERACWEIGISVQELVSNIVRHAGGGQLELHAKERAIEIIATDAGPGIPPAMIAASQTSQRGLGALRRLMHELQFESLVPQGTRILARRFLDRKP